MILSIVEIDEIYQAVHLPSWWNR